MEELLRQKTSSVSQSSGDSIYVPSGFFPQVPQTPAFLSSRRLRLGVKRRNVPVLNGSEECCGLQLRPLTLQVTISGSTLKLKPDAALGPDYPQAAVADGMMLYSTNMIAVESLRPVSRQPSRGRS